MTSSDESEFDSEEEEEDEDEDDLFSSSQPIHFRECLRLLDSALSSSSFSTQSLPPWFAHQTFETFIDPHIVFHSNKPAYEIYPMKINIIENVSFQPNAFQISPTNFTILNKNIFEENIRHFSRNLSIEPDDIQLKLSKFILLKSFPYPRQFQWDTNDQSIAKLCIFLPMTTTTNNINGKEILKFANEKHSFDFHRTFSYTLLPTSSECSYEIDSFTRGQRQLLIYDLFPCSPNLYFNLSISESILYRISKILENWLIGLENDYHGYLTKIILPFSDFNHVGKNLLLYRYDRILGSILQQSLANEFLLYQGIIQPNRTNDGTSHACRLLTDLKLLNKTRKFHSIQTCLGNCNESYTGNIFLKKIRTDQGNILSIEKFAVPIFCLIPMKYKYDFYSIDNLDYELIDWLLTTKKNKSLFQSKKILHFLLKNPEENLMKKFIEHETFLDEFFPINTHQEYEDLIELFQNYFPQKLPNIFRKLSNKTSEKIQFLGILSNNKKQFDENIFLILIHDLVHEMFQINHSIPSITDLINLLALLSLSTNNYEISCEFLSKQIQRTQNLITNFIVNYRAILIPVIIRIYRKYSPNWLINLANYCLNLLNTSVYQSTIDLLDEHCCQLCRNLNEFFQDSNCFEKDFLIDKQNQFEHFEYLTKNSSQSLIIQTNSLTLDKRFLRIHLIKMSIYDENIYYENQLLRSIISNFHFYEQSSDKPMRKKFKSSSS